MPGLPEFRNLPSVDRVLALDELSDVVDRLGREAIVAFVREVLEDARQRIASGASAPTLDWVVGEVRARTLALSTPGPRPVINATGVIIHTNLGRAPLSREAAEAMRVAAAGYSDLEFDLESGSRGSRHSHVDRLLQLATGAEAGIVVNNNAAAVLLVLATFAAGREVIVSRGQAVEIGGGFRIPDVLTQSGATLVEVGTTNRTYLSDYERAITEQTGLILRVHTSNFRVVGFVHGVSIRALVELGSAHDLPVVDDVGSGCLIDPRQFGLSNEPVVQDSVSAGASLVCFSGDKLLGGPQAGIVVGKRDLIARLKAHPWARALRIDKASLAALTATLTHYVKGEALQKVPVWQMISTDPAEIRARVERWCAALGGAPAVVPTRSTIGGGSLPEDTLPSFALALSAAEGPDALARRLRASNPPVIGRIENDRLLLDGRTVLPDEDDLLLRVVWEALGG